MTIEVRVIGPDNIGAPGVVIGSDAEYRPDVASDLCTRAVDTYRAAFGIDAPDSVEAVDLDGVYWPRTDDDPEAGQ